MKSIFLRQHCRDVDSIARGPRGMRLAFSQFGYTLLFVVVVVVGWCLVVGWLVVVGFGVPNIGQMQPTTRT